LDKSGKLKNLNKKYYDWTEDKPLIQEYRDQVFVKFFKGVRTLYINDEPDRFNPYLNKLAAQHDEKKAQEIKERD